MYTIYLSLAVAFVVAVLPALFGVSVAWTVLPGLIAGVATFVWVNRRMAKRVEAVTRAADAEINALQQAASRQPTTPQQVKQMQAAASARIDAAVSILQQGFLFQKWQLGVTTMLNARIGMLLFTRWAQLGTGSATDAVPYLRRSVVRGRKASLLSALWPAWAMLAVCELKGNEDLDAAAKVLEDAVVVARKEGLLWSLYGWILAEAGRIDEAIDVLARAKSATSDDERVVSNLVALQNKKKMSMKEYGEQWFQFGLEKPKGTASLAQQRLMQQQTPQPRMGHPRAKGRGGRR